MVTFGRLASIDDFNQAYFDRQLEVKDNKTHTINCIECEKDEFELLAVTEGFHLLLGKPYYKGHPLILRSER